MHVSFQTTQIRYLPARSAPEAIILSAEIDFVPIVFNWRVHHISVCVRLLHDVFACNQFHMRLAFAILLHHQSVDTRRLLGSTERCRRAIPSMAGPCPLDPFAGVAKLGLATPATEPAASKCV